MRKRWLLIGLIVVLQVGDILSTNAALSAEGVSEANPIIAWAQSYYGAFWWVFKLAPVPIMAFCLLRMPTSRPAVITALIFIAVIINNLLWSL